MSRTPSPRALRAFSFSWPSSALACAAVLAVASGAGAQQGRPVANGARAQLGYATWTPAPPPLAGALVWPAAAPATAATPPPDAAVAKPQTGRASAAFDLAVVTEVPLLVGGQATLEVPYGFLFQGEVGVLPSAYVDAANGALAGAGAYGAATSQLIRDGFGDAPVVRLSAGWRPFADHGLELLGGYTFMSLNGTVSASQAATAAGATLPAGMPDAQIALRSTVHSVHASLGWRWLLTDHVVLRASVGYLQAVSSSSHADLSSSSTMPAAVTAQMATANRQVDATLNDTYTKYLKLPVLGLSLAYRF